VGNHEYDEFEDKLRRWDAAERLVSALASEIRDGRDPWDDRWNPSDQQLDAMIDEWLSPETVVCQDKNSGECPGPEACGRRCTTAYWRAHGYDVAHNMAALARDLAEDDRLWYVVGRIHDVDYPKSPHHDAAVSSDDSHPMALARSLHASGAALAAVLAILTHAPHLRLRPSSPLAWALLACDEHATMTAYARANPAMEPAYPAQLASMTSLLQPATSTIRGGYRREDMQARANLGFQKLLDYKTGRIERFDRRGFADRIDWDAEARITSLR
jgi:predicted hydrolase (HD superfamily)